MKLKSLIILNFIIVILLNLSACGGSSGIEVEVDSDGDGYFDYVDNCPSISNNQSDQDNDGRGDVCDDSDNDDLVDVLDNCPNTTNPDQLDLDSDGRGDACDDDLDGDTIANLTDNCPDNSNTNQHDRDNNGLGDACDDPDQDSVYDSIDNCPDTPNTDQSNIDGDEIGDECDNDMDGDSVENLLDAQPSNSKIASTILINKNGDVWFWGFDSLGRPTLLEIDKLLDSNVNHTETWSYTSFGLISEYYVDLNNDGIYDRSFIYRYLGVGGRLFERISNEGTRRYKYEEDGSRQERLETGTGVFIWEYDSENRLLLEMADPDAGNSTTESLTRYTYDTNGNLIRVASEYNTYGNGPERDVVIYTYDSNNNLLSESKDPEGNGVITSRTFYKYDSSNNQIERSADWENDGHIDILFSYVYNDKNELIRYTRDGNNDGTPDRIEDYAYDLRGNRVLFKRTVPNSSAFDFTFNYTFTFDESDNLTYNKYVRTSETINDSYEKNYLHEFDELKRLTKYSSEDRQLTWEYAGPSIEQPPKRVYDNLPLKGPFILFLSLPDHSSQ